MTSEASSSKPGASSMEAVRIALAVHSILHRYTGGIRGGPSHLSPGTSAEIPRTILSSAAALEERRTS